MVKKHQSNITVIEDQLIALYPKGVSTRDIQDHLANPYGIEVSISSRHHQALDADHALSLPYDSR